MIVRCENCQTEFALDDAQVGPEGVTVRCSMCAYVFKVRPPAGSASSQPWQIQTTEDLLFTAPDLETLKGWIVEGRLHPDDRVSRTGNHWLKLGEMPEFSAMFPGYKGLPKVFQAVAPGAKKPDAERSAVDELGPPPVFGSEVSSTKSAAEIASMERSVGVPKAREHQPSSPLDAVTKHAVRPITSNALDAVAAKADQAKPVSQERARSTAAESWDDESRVHRSERGGSNWMLWAALGVVSAVAVIFGVPQIRQVVLGGGDDDEPVQTPEPEVAAPQARPELEKANAALASLGVADISRAEAAIQRAIDTGAVKDATLANMRLAQADLLVSRALVFTIAGALDAAQHDKLIKRADDDLDRANRIFESIGQAPDGERMSLVRARLRLAQGRDAVEITALLPETGADEMQLAVEASPLWREADAKVPSNLISRLQGLEKPSALGLSVLALALLRSGDTDGATKVAERLLALAEDQPVAMAIKNPGVATAPPVVQETATGGTGGAETPTPPEPAAEGGETKVATAGGGGSGGGGGGSGGGGGGGASSFERLLEKGCNQVESGSASAGIETLLKAFDRNPRDLDVLVCLGKGYEKSGNKPRALHFYEQALAQSPRHRSALRGAASVAAESGAEGKALKYYTRLLQVDPMNAKAKVYVEQHGGGGGGGTSEGGGDSGGGGGEQPGSG